MEEIDTNKLIKDLEQKINKLELKKDELNKENNKLEIEKGILENNVIKLKKELKDEFGIEDIENENIDDLITYINKKLKEVEEDE